jgi:acyl-homoserine-lactone acylase
MQQVRLPVLDGSTSACDWGSDSDAVVPGIFGPSHLPVLFRNDYTDNANNSYWLANPHQPLVGFPQIMGPVATQRSWRTRLNLRIIEDRLHGTDGLPGNRFTLAGLQELALGNRQYAGELFQADVVAMCRSMLAPVWTVADTCDVVAAWDTHDNLDSSGAILFRRFVERVNALQVQEIYTAPFDANDPVNTPRGLNTASPRVRQALQDAVDDLRSSHIPFDAALRTYQYRLAGGRRIAVHGGPGADGDFNSVYAGDGVHADGWVPGHGYPDVGFGSSFIMAVQFDATDCPKGASILTYSQSTNPTSPHFADQTETFSTKTWNPLPYCLADIKADPELTLTRI